MTITPKQTKRDRRYRQKEGDDGSYCTLYNAIFPDFHSPNRHYPREEKRDIQKIHICEIMGSVVIFRKNKMKKTRSPKVSLLVLIGGTPSVLDSRGITVLISPRPPICKVVFLL